MRIALSMIVSALRIGRNRHWSFVFFDHGAGLLGDPFGFLLGPDAPPFVGRFGVSDVAIGQTK